ncbi:hypothetical protein L198_02143 [Cryptococcus wingfieldii CBS 7118]|uniref:Uncharacterized protein n=1 Tax=Cryptococcus wingfieldii CBS 7118 TaxID=1295528 RepID=A0A1E3JX89_9TREE|nr:hypothetical protein L198_02143 [Cryptococcus wingfieldii CBS 7118]ODO05450.1 hypothetical protein L198_02143 [Cryptococcus wingfieldii CBS 7118]
MSGTTATSDTSTSDLGDDGSFVEKYIWVIVIATVLILASGLTCGLLRKYHKRGRMTVWSMRPHCRECHTKLASKSTSTSAGDYGLHKLWCCKAKVYWCDDCDKKARKEGYA